MSIEAKGILLSESEHYIRTDETNTMHYQTIQVFLSWAQLYQCMMLALHHEDILVAFLHL